MKHIRHFIAAAMIAGGGVLGWGLMGPPAPDVPSRPKSDSSEKRELIGLMHGKRLLGEYHDGKYNFYTVSLVDSEQLPSILQLAISYSHFAHQEKGDSFLPFSTGALIAMAQCHYMLHDYTVQRLSTQRYHITSDNIESADQMKSLQERVKHSATRRVGPPPTDFRRPIPPPPPIMMEDPIAENGAGSTTHTAAEEPEMLNPEEIAAMKEEYERKYQAAYQQALQELQQQDERYPKSDCPPPASFDFIIEVTERSHLFPQGKRMVTFYAFSTPKDNTVLGYPLPPAGTEMLLHAMNNAPPR